LACFRYHTTAPTKSSGSGVYDNGGTSYLLCSCGSCTPCPSGGIRCGMLGILRTTIWCTPHQLLSLLLQFYGLELHHLIPLGILHIAAFVTLCESYMGIESHFNLWNNLVRVQLRPDSDEEATIWGCADSYVRTSRGLTHTSASHYPTLQSGGGKNGSS
jgi:hypothetical protein